MPRTSSKASAAIEPVGSLGRFGTDPEAARALLPIARELHLLPRADREAALRRMKPNTVRALRELDFEWALFARPQQLAPEGDWRWWVMCGGRGGGKTRSACEWWLDYAWNHPGERGAMISKDAGGYRKIMIRGRSGVLRRSPPWFKPRWWKTDKLLEWPNGFVAELHTSEEPETLRGPEYHVAWITELFHWAIPRGEKAPTAWEQGIKFGLRLGQAPRGIIDSTPLQTEFCQDFLLGPEDHDGARVIDLEKMRAGSWSIAHEIELEDGPHRYAVEVRRWSSEDNAANLSRGFVQELRREYGESELAEIELDGMVVVRPKGSLFRAEDLDGFTVAGVPRMKLTAVAVDPTRADAPTDECGIMVGGLGYDGHAYIWDDCSLTASPRKYAQAIVAAANSNKADYVVLEKNRLPQKTRTLIRTTEGGEGIQWREVTAAENKQTRAEPTAAKVAEGRVHLVRHANRPRLFDRLKSELVNWNPRASKKSPNRMDAFVWLVTFLLKLDSSTRTEIS